MLFFMTQFLYFNRSFKVAPRVEKTEVFRKVGILQIGFILRDA